MMGFSYRALNCSRCPLYSQCLDGDVQDETVQGRVLSDPDGVLEHLVGEFRRRGWESVPNLMLDVLRVVGKLCGHFAREITCLRDLVLTVVMSPLAHCRHAGSTFTPSVSVSAIPNVR